MRLIDADNVNWGRCPVSGYAMKEWLAEQPTIDAVPVVRCKDCKHRNKKKCPLVMVRLDVKTNGTIKEVLEQNYVDEDFWCKDGRRKDGEG